MRDLIDVFQKCYSFLFLLIFRGLLFTFGNFARASFVRFGLNHFDLVAGGLEVGTFRLRLEQRRLDMVLLC